MEPEELFGTLLALGECWWVKGVTYQESLRRFVIEIEETDQLWSHERCPRDGGDVRLYDHAPSRQWRHLNVFNHECVLQCALPRGKCLDCRHVYRVQPPWEGKGKHFSKEFEAFALTLCREMPVKRASDILGESDQSLWRMLKAYVSEAHEQLEMSKVTCVGVDEMSIRKGHCYASVFADLKARRVLYATEGKDHTVWDRFAQELGRHNGHPHGLLHVSMDMSRAYQKGVRENCRHAQITFDKFHVIAKANEAVDEVCRNERRRGTNEASAQLKQTRWLWRKNPQNLTDEQQQHMDTLDQEMLQTAQAYQMKLQLQNLYQSPYRSWAKRGLQAWCRRAQKMAQTSWRGLLKPIGKLANMIEKHLEGILAHWESHVTNAYMEALNSVFSATKRKARGYRTTENLITMLYFVAGKLNIPSAMYH